jgi:hypothetical protein
MNNGEMNEYKCKDCLHYSSGKCFIKVIDKKENVNVDKDDSCEKIFPTTKAYLEHNKF